MATVDDDRMKVQNRHDRAGRWCHRRALSRRVETADVWVGHEPAATLSRREGGIEFAYDNAYLAADSRPVATTLPLSDEPVRTSGGALPPFFSGLLPEGRRLTGLRAAVKTSADDELSLLLAVGEDLVGDVRVLPQGMGGESTLPARQLRPVSPSGDGPAAQGEVDFAQLDFADLAASEGLDPAALAGVQDKVSGRMLTIPLADEGRLHLLKLNPPEYPHVVENEAFFLGVARRLRHPVVEARVVHDRQDRAGLLVTRFDRAVDLMAPSSGWLSKTAPNCWVATRPTSTPSPPNHCSLGSRR